MSDKPHALKKAVLFYFHCINSVKFIPKTTLGQIVAINTVTLAATYGVSLCLLSTVSSLIPPRPIWPLDNIVAVVQVAQVLGAVPAAQRLTLLPALSSAHVHVALSQSPVLCDATSRDASTMERRLKTLLPSYANVLHAQICPAEDNGRGEAMQVVIPFNDQAADIRLEEPDRPDTIALSILISIGLLFLLIAAAAFSVWAAWRITRPLRRLSRIAEAFGQDIVVAPVLEDGPQEIRQVAQEFNQMQKRIAAHVQDRAYMLAAISHDLRSPLTRLRLRAEIDVVGEMRFRMLDDIDQLNEMIDSALVFLQGQTTGAKDDRIDIGGLLSTICDKFRQVGVEIARSGEIYLLYPCQPLAIHRAVTNLIENARTYGENARVHLRSTEDEVLIEVSDDGPGIPDLLKLSVQQPFTRLETARTTGRGNMGLGLAIVSEVARTHGGRLELSDCVPHGLHARLVLPACRPRKT